MEEQMSEKSLVIIETKKTNNFLLTLWYIIFAEISAFLVIALLSFSICNFFSITDLDFIISLIFSLVVAVNALALALSNYKVTSFDVERTIRIKSVKRKR
jgi:hypothetical protein